MDSTPRTGSRHRGALLGLATGDALGTTVEFSARGTFEPVTDMVGGGPFGLEPGQWTDDTSMALCLGASLLEKGGFDAADQMERYLRWRDDGYMSSTGRCFDIGTTVGGALREYERTGDPFSGPTDPDTAGNGCIMRLAPVPMAATDEREAAEWGELSARTTHGAKECREATLLFSVLLWRALHGASKEELTHPPPPHGLDPETLSPPVRAILEGEWREKSRRRIHGTGYVVKSLEAALWCFDRADSFAEAVLEAVNLGDDADTTGAVCGPLAGAHWGEEGIPLRWRERVARADVIRGMADRLCERRHGRADVPRSHGSARCATRS